VSSITREAGIVIGFLHGVVGKLGLLATAQEGGLPAVYATLLDENKVTPGSYFGMCDLEVRSQLPPRRE